MINKTRPAYFPLHGTLGVNTVAPEDSLYIQASYPSGLPVPSGDHNGKLNSNGQWASYNDATLLRVQDWLDTTNAQALADTRLTYVNGGNVLTTGAVVATRGAYLLLGGRFETDDALLNPVGADVSASPLVYPSATVPGRIWLYTNIDGELRVSSVGPADADAPQPDELTIAGLQIDAAGVVTDGSLVPVTLPLPTRRIAVVSPQYLTGPVEINGTGMMLTVTGGQIAGGDVAAYFDGGAGPALFAGNNSAVDYAQVVSNGNGSGMLVTGVSANGALVVAGASGRGISCTATGASASIRVFATSTGRGIDVTRTGSGVGVYADTSGGTNYAIQALGPAGGTSLYASTTSGNAVEAVASGTGIAVRATGGASAASVALRGESTHDDAFAVQGLTTVTANVTSAGVLGTGRNNGVGVYGLATGNGYGVVAQADATSPARASLLLSPQDADPTLGARGSLTHNSNRGPTGKLRTYTTQWESVHSTARGYVKAWGIAESGGPIGGGSGNLSSVQVTPEQVGDVLVTATGSLEFSTDTTNCTVQLLDLTSPATIATQVERAIDTDGAGTNIRSFVIRGIRTLPNTVTRDFAVTIQAAGGGTITYSNVICSVEGVQ